MPNKDIQGLGLDGSVSHGTMRPQDLIPKFVDVLEQLYTQAEMDAFWAGQPALEKLCPEGSGFPADDSPLWDTDETQFFLNETLFDALNECAPKGYRFGAHEGDGSDYGFWAVETEEDPEEGPDDCSECGEPIHGDEGFSPMGASVRHKRCADGPIPAEPTRLQLWAAFRGRTSLAEVCDMLRQDVEAEPNLPEPEILQAKHYLTAVEHILKKRNV